MCLTLLQLVQERVLLAERALLYCFNFDFKTSDPYSYALKYNNTYKLLEGDDSQRAFAWLNIAALATTLCLQYPASLLGVVAVWYAQHLVLGEVCSNPQHPSLLLSGMHRVWCLERWVDTHNMPHFCCVIWGSERLISTSMCLIIAV